MRLLPATKAFNPQWHGMLTNNDVLIIYGSVQEIREFVRKNGDKNVFGWGSNPIFLIAGWYEKVAGQRTHADNSHNRSTQAFHKTVGRVVDTPVLSFFVKRFMVGTTAIRTFHYIALVSQSSIRTKKDACKQNYLQGQKLAVCLEKFDSSNAQSAEANQNLYIKISALAEFVNGPTLVNFNNASIGYRPRN